MSVQFNIPNLHHIKDEIIVNPNILLKSSSVIISNNIHIDKYILEIYTNCNIKIINETKKTEYVYINDYIEIIPSLINVYISLFKTICDKNQLDNFIISIKMAKTYFHNINYEKKVIDIDGLDKDELFQCNKKIKTENDFVDPNIKITNNEDSEYNKLLELYKKSQTEIKLLKSEIKRLKNRLSEINKDFLVDISFFSEKNECN